jgi:hypothetical protein
MTLRSLLNPLRKRTARRCAQSPRARLRLTPLESRVTPSAPIPVGPNFQVNTYTQGLQRTGDIAMDALGNFAVVWEGEGPGDIDGVFAQRFNAAGVPQGGQFRVNSYTAERQGNYPSIAMSPAGDFVVTWGSQGQDGSGDGIYAQRCTTVQCLGRTSGW